MVMSRSSAARPTETTSGSISFMLLIAFLVEVSEQRPQPPRHGADHEVDLCRRHRKLRSLENEYDMFEVADRVCDLGGRNRDLFGKAGTAHRSRFSPALR